MKQENKESLIGQLIKMAWSDSEHKESEKTLIYTMAKMIGLDASAVDSLYEKYIEFEPPKLVFDRILQFHRLVLLVNIDNEVSNREKSDLRRAGLLLGLNSNSVDTVISEMNKHKNGMIPSERMMEIFQKNFN